MALVGVGLGSTMQNLVLAVQNNTRVEDLGAASSVVAFFRSLGGSIGVSVLGAVLSTQVAGTVRTGLADLGVPQTEHQSSSIPDLSALPGPVRDLYEHAFGTAIGHIYLVAVPFAILALVCVLFIKEVPLRTTLETAADPTTAQTPASAKAGPVEAHAGGATVPVPAARVRR